jgi:hypothetical protein
VPNMKLVTMRHDEIEHGDKPLPVTTVQAFEDVWKAKGWKLVDDATLDADALDEKTVEQLKTLAANQGVEVPSGAKKADIIAALTAGQEG